MSEKAPNFKAMGEAFSFMKIINQKKMRQCVQRELIINFAWRR